jgi:hypothetical protein
LTQICLFGELLPSWNKERDTRVDEQAWDASGYESNFEFMFASHGFVWVCVSSSCICLLTLIEYHFVVLPERSNSSIVSTSTQSNHHWDSPWFHTHGDGNWNS